MVVGSVRDDSEKGAGVSASSDCALNKHSNTVIGTPVSCRLFGEQIDKAICAEIRGANRRPIGLDLKKIRRNVDSWK